MPVPAGVVTAMRPVVAAAGTVATIWEADETLKPAAAVPLKVTAVAPVRRAPEMVTDVPAGPEAGLNAPTAGATGAAAVTVKEAALVPVPATVVTAMRPDVAPAGTVAVS